MKPPPTLQHWWERFCVEASELAVVEQGGRLVLIASRILLAILLLTSPRHHAMDNALCGHRKYMQACRKHSRLEKKDFVFFFSFLSVLVKQCSKQFLFVYFSVKQS